MLKYNSCKLSHWTTLLSRKVIKKTHKFVESAYTSPLSSIGHSYQRSRRGSSFRRVRSGALQSLPSWGRYDKSWVARCVRAMRICTIGPCSRWLEVLGGVWCPGGEGLWWGRWRLLLAFSPFSPCSSRLFSFKLVASPGVSFSLSPACGFWSGCSPPFLVSF